MKRCWAFEMKWRWEKCLVVVRFSVAFVFNRIFSLPTSQSFVNPLYAPSSSDFDDYAPAGQSNAAGDASYADFVPFGNSNAIYSVPRSPSSASPARHSKSDQGFFGVTSADSPYALATSSSTDAPTASDGYLDVLSETDPLASGYIASRNAHLSAPALAQPTASSGEDLYQNSSLHTCASASVTYQPAAASGGGHGEETVEDDGEQGAADEYGASESLKHSPVTSSHHADAEVEPEASQGPGVYSQLSKQAGATADQPQYHALQRYATLDPSLRLSGGAPPSGLYSHLHHGAIYSEPLGPGADGDAVEYMKPSFLRTAGQTKAGGDAAGYEIAVD